MVEIQNIKVGVCHCYLIEDEGTILVDGGAPGELAAFTDGLARYQIPATRIQAVIITHCHWDHIGCVKQIKDLSGAKVLVQESEKGILATGSITMPPSVTLWGRIFAAFLKRLIRNLSIEPVEPDIVIGKEDVPLADFGINGKIVYTPGHSPGSVSVVLDSGQAFVGDMAMNGLPLTIGPSLPIFAEDIPLLKQSWKRLLDIGPTHIYPAHGKPFYTDTIRKRV